MKTGNVALICALKVGMAIHAIKNVLAAEEARIRLSVSCGGLFV